MPDRRVLIVEDHDPTRNALLALFQRKGWRAEAVSTLAEGMSRLDPPPTCVILDLMLPDGDGAVILGKVRSERLPTCVAVCTGSHDPDRLDAVARLAPDALLHKPVALPDILAACDCLQGRP